MQTIGVIGAGAWGTALAQVLSHGGRDVLIWAREPAVAQSINAAHENAGFLPDTKLDERLKATNDLAEVAGRDVLLLVTPAQYIRATLQTLRPIVSRETILVICAKGIELNTGKLLSEICAEEMPESPVAILTGPTFAAEVAKGLPTAVTIGAQNPALAKALQTLLGVKHFRPYISDDLVGVQLGGAIKNVIAIACGVVHGRGLGENARCALLTRGMAEIVRLGMAMGAQEQTLLGLCGMGDLVLTASSPQSRNFSLGMAIGAGKTMSDILKTRSAVTEGVHTAESTLALAAKYGVDMPVTQVIYECLHQDLSIDAAIEALLNRPFR